MDSGLGAVRRTQNARSCFKTAARFSFSTVITRRRESFWHGDFELFRKTLAENHQFSASPRMTLAGLDYRREEYAKARGQMEHAMRIQRNALPGDHIDLTRSRISARKHSEADRRAPKITQALAVRGGASASLTKHVGEPDEAARYRISSSIIPRRTNRLQHTGRCDCYDAVQHHGWIPMEQEERG
jgi:hypothetical protein